MRPSETTDEDTTYAPTDGADRRVLLAGSALLGAGAFAPTARAAVPAPAGTANPGVYHV
ncbi:hypothetical protein [Roseomonas rosulenta]|uniref:hypothetical protein n=1 Tax=Roseomonas rosulenta TaxID=2748667 RepID=UPI0018DFB131|nr:hypothetical protein [Roseomonas rosulenta]